MNRRGFLKAIAAGVATVALTTRLATTRVDAVIRDLFFADGSDITIQLQAAINEAAMTGSTVHIPAGKYFISKTVVAPDGVSINGMGSVLKWAGDNYSPLLEFGGGGSVVSNMSMQKAVTAIRIRQSN